MNNMNFDDVDFNEMIAEEEITDNAFKSIIGSTHRSIEAFRIFLMFCACVLMQGLPIEHSYFLKSVCGFAPIAFFILSGILILGDPEEREDRIKRAIVRTAIAFGSMLVFGIAMNLIYINVFDNGVMPDLKSAGTWVKFIFLNIWPFEVGNAIWYVQALLYAYIIIFFINKFDLLKYDRIIVAALILFTVISGELRGVIPLNIPVELCSPNFFNRALPYLLFGGILARDIKFWAQINPWTYLAGIGIGIGLVYAEPKLLLYMNVAGNYNHLIGMTVIASSICLLLFWDVVNRAIDECETSSFYDFFLSRRSTNFIYYVFQYSEVLFGLLAMKISSGLGQRLSPYMGIITFIILFFAVTAILSTYRFIIVRNADINSGDPG